MTSTYLQGGDPATYGVPNATPAQINEASALVDAYLQRPEGMVWSPDANGAPAYMAGLGPSFTLTSTGSIAPGQNVVVAVGLGQGLTNDMIGEALILDRATPSKTEVCVVSAVGAGTITLASVGIAHTGAVVMEAGLVLLEERSLPANRSVTRVSRTPVARLISGVGRYAYGRRSQQISGNFNDINMLASVQAFGGPPMWVPFDVTQASVSTGTGEVWVPAGLMLAYYSDVRLRYVAGYPYAGLPSPIKQATASIVGTMQDFPEVSGNMKRISAGKTTIERFSDTVLDADTKNMLTPFQAKLFF